MGQLGNFLVVLVWFFESYVKQKCLSGGITSSGTALLKPCCLVDETGALSWWEEMTAGNIIELQGNKTEWKQ